MMGETESVVIFRIDWMDWYQADIRRSDNVMEVWVNDKKVRIGLQYQHTYNCEYDYIFMLNEREEEWVDAKEELTKPTLNQTSLEDAIE